MSACAENILVNASSPHHAGEAGFSNRLTYAVGGISFGISSRNSSLKLAFEPGILDFQLPDDICDVEMSADWTNRLQMPSRKPAFESGGLWSAFPEDGGTRFYFRTAYLGEEPYKSAWFNEDFTRGEVLLLKRYFDQDIPVYPLEYPLDELLMIHRISRGEGAEVHGCGLVTREGQGLLFIGHSGAGKSTTSRLWLDQPGTTVLSDDRIILRVQNGSLRMYGTPWHGDAGLAAQAFAPVHKIYLLQHGSRNEAVLLDPAQAAAELFSRTFVPHHSAKSVARTLEFLDSITTSVPVHLFRFVPEASAVSEILRAS